MILDRRNRWRACQALGIEVAADQSGADEDQVAYIISKDLYRRQLDASQRAMVGARIASFKQGGDRTSEQVANLRLAPTREKVGGLLNVSPRVLSNARLILEKGSPAQIAAVVAQHHQTIFNWRQHHPLCATTTENIHGP